MSETRPDSRQDKYPSSTRPQRRIWKAYPTLPEPRMRAASDNFGSCKALVCNLNDSLIDVQRWRQLFSEARCLLYLRVQLLFRVCTGRVFATPRNECMFVPLRKRSSEAGCQNTYLSPSKIMPRLERTSAYLSYWSVCISFSLTLRLDLKHH